MPIYEYECKDCGKISEVLVFGNDEAVSCAFCNSSDLKKLMSAHSTVGSSDNRTGGTPAGCCGMPNSCGSPGSCCGG